MTAEYNQNVDKLSAEAIDLLAFAKGPITIGWEVRLDDPIRNIIEGGDGYVWHSLTWSPHYLLHAGDDDWAIVDAESITGDADKGRLIALDYLKEYPEEKPATGLARYAVKRDKFEEADVPPGSFFFPCYYCAHRSKSAKMEPCRTCDHNANAAPEEPSE